MAVFALSAITANAAFAESEWLVNGEPIAEGVSIEGTMEGFWLYSDLNTAFGSAEMLCDLALDINFKAKGIFRIVKILTLGGIEVSSEGGATPLECTGEKLCGLTLVWAANLPWAAEVVLMTGTGELELLFLLSEGATTGTSPAFLLECTILGMRVQDLCEGPTSFWLLNMAEEVPADVLGLASEANLDEESLLATCSLGGQQANGLESEEESGAFGGALILATGKALAVS